jgi:hypothetical protein
MNVQVDGSGANIFPSPFMGVSVNSSLAAAVTTTTFVKDVSPGPHTILVRFSTGVGTASAAYRTLTASIFTP